MSKISDIWEDQEIKFDLSLSQMKTKDSEIVIDQVDFIEDTKGNGGDKGRLLITNLRIIWHSLSFARISLSIGYNCIQNITTKIVNSRLKGITEAMHILTKLHNTRYEFIFTNLIPGSSRHFTSVTGIYKAYNSSRIYRELKLRGALVQNKLLKVLDKETVYFTVEGVWNLSSDQGNLGSFVVTNVRIVWFADMNETFNVSLPYIQIASIKVRDSRFGHALVMESTINSGGYVLGFRIDPSEKLHATTKKLQSLYEIHSKRPELGVSYTIRNEPLLPEKPPMLPQEEPEFDDELDEMTNALSSYCLDNESTPQGKEENPVYCADLGLAVEPLKEGYTMQSLWEVLPADNTN